jgi:hypothetical protein
VKNLYLLLLYILIACSSFGQTGQWTWLKGDPDFDQPGFYGQKNLAEPFNNPSSRQAVVTWTDGNGNLWMFGGEHDGLLYNDLWVYDIGINMWVWISGDNKPNTRAVYGTRQQTNSEVKPGARRSAVSWVDRSGNMWMFGGIGYDREERGHLNDLWVYVPRENQWYWMSGNDHVNSVGIYGSRGVPGRSNMPGARYGAVSWTDNDEYLYLFGGRGYSHEPVGHLNDLWQYDIRRDVWTWISGEQKPNQPTRFHDRGNPSPFNMPGSRVSPISWSDEEKNLWLFGGYGFGERDQGAMNDIWKFDTKQMLWVWEGGSKEINNLGHYGRKGLTDADNLPPAREGATGFTDRAGNRWLFGGYIALGEMPYRYNDLWMQDRDTKRWIWVSGDNKSNQPGRYGARGVENEKNKPGARAFAGGGSDKQSNLYVFGGRGQANWNIGYNNDLWVFKPDIRRQVEIICPANLLLQTTEKSCTVRPRGLAPRILYTRDTALIYILSGATNASGNGIVDADFNLGTTTVKYLLANDTTKFCSFRVTVVDQISPRPKIEKLPDVHADCSIDISNRPTAIDNCAGIITGTTSSPLSFNTPGLHIITWTYDDGNGNQTKQTQQVLIADKTAPVPIVESLPGISGECIVRVSKPPTAIDECDGTITGTTKDPLQYTVPGTYTITWIYRDSKGNESRQKQVVTVRSTSGKFTPLLDPLPDVTGECSATVVDIPKAAKNCGGIVSAQTKDPLKYDKQGTHVITWTYNDGNGNKFEQTQKVIVKDSKVPIPNVKSLPDIIGECSVIVSTIPTAKDNCSGTITAITREPLQYDNPGTYTITWLYSDKNGNGYSQIQRVIVTRGSVGLKPLKEKLPDIIGECSASVTHIPRAAGDCGTFVQGTTTDPLFYSSQGNYVVRWNYKDGNGNTLYQTQNVIIKDTRPPSPDVKTLPDIVSECSANIQSKPVATDNCAGVVRATTTDPLNYDKPGVYNIRWTYKDAAGNTSAQEQKVIVKESSGKLVPLVSSLPDITGECAATVTVTPQASKNCGPLYTASTTDPLIYSTPGTHIITWIYKDENGNSVEQTQRVIISDRTKPVPTFEQLPDLIGECEVTVTQRPTATDNCSGLVTGFTNDPLQYNSKGSYIIRWTFGDKNGNATEQLQNVIVKSASGPITPLVASLPDIIGECSAVIETKPRASKACGNIVSATTTDPLIYNSQGTHIIRWTYKDDTGNQLVQTQRVIIKDRKSPVPSKKTLPDVIGDCFATISSIPTATDNCGGMIKGVATDPLSYNKKGTHIVNWKYEDANGNITVQQQRVIVKNESAFNSNLSELAAIEGNCQVVVTKKPTIKNGCGQTIIATTKDPLNYSKAGIYTINWIYKISESENRTQTQQVVVKDDKEPVPLFDSLPDIIAFCSVEINAIPRAVDNCAGIIKATTTDTLEYSDRGEYIINWIYEDGNGNSRTQTQKVIVKAEPIEITAIPNPTHNEFQIKVKLCNDQKLANLSVYDVLGRLIERREIKVSENIRLGAGYASSSYFIVITQGDERVVKKIVKIRG